MIMMMPCRLVLGLLVLNLVLASPPRYTRQVEPDNYEDVEYFNELTTDEPEKGVNPVFPYEDIEPAPEASLEEEEEEKEQEIKHELPITPSFIPSGSGVPDVLMGPNTQGEKELRLTPTETLHISGDSLGSGSSGASGIFEKIPGTREYHSRDTLGSGGSGGLSSGGFAETNSGHISSEGSVDLGSGVSGDLVSGVSGELVSGVSGDLSSGVSGDFSSVSGDFVSGASGDFVSSVSGDFVSGASGDFVSSVSGDFVSGASGDIVSGVSGDIVSGASGDFVSGNSGHIVSGVSGDFVSGVSGDFVSGVSGDFVSGVSGDFVSGVSGDFVSGVSGDFVTEVSGELIPGVSGDFYSGVSGSFASGVSGDFVSGASGDFVSGVSGDFGTGPSGDIVSGDSGDFGSGPSGDIVSGDSGDIVSGDSGDFGSGDSEEFTITVTTGPEEFKEGDSEESGNYSLPNTPWPPEESGLPDGGVTTIIPIVTEEEEPVVITQTPPQEGTDSTTGSGLDASPEPDTEVFEIDVQGMPTCILCTCLGGSVYCDDVKLVNVPPLPKDTTHFYARYNRITKINKSDFANMNKLKRIDLTSNGISKIEDSALFGLPALQELVIRENNVAQLPALPKTMTLVDASHNNLGRTGIQHEAFKDMTGLLYLYLTDNRLDHIPIPLPESLRSLHLQNNNIQMIHEDTFCKRNDLNFLRMALEDIRLDGNPVVLSRTPQAYVCLPRIPIGALF
ncbi:hypothetical protein HF521_007586 [Silurus meridionalis]|uniref:LRRNT domain-containing protein n=1 Tax=Silurus meridionalis TaxID=175797 RepID=A0A8T0APD1_SILME|nr:hypothetical protein HF521_007586 [Silurus meridionalis]